LASSRDTQNGPDWKDVARALLDFERTLDCSISVTVKAAGSFRTPLLLMQAAAWGHATDSQEAKLLASASVSMPGAGAGDIAAALLLLGYELDKEAYRRQEGMTSSTA